MSKKSKDNNQLSEREWLNQQMSKASAAGNKPVESAKGVDNNEPPVMDSVNSPNATQINGKDIIVNGFTGQPVNVSEKMRQMATNAKPSNKIEADINQKKTDYLAKIGISGPNKTIASKQEDEQTRQDNKMRSMGYMVQDRSKPDDAQIEATVRNSQTFKDIVNEGRRREEEAKEKSMKASRYAKASAWGNMFSALGQIAGLGKNVYMKPDNQYLNKALTKADEARAIYDKAKEYNATAPKEYLKQATNALKEDFYKRQKDYNDFVVKYNKDVTTRRSNEAKAAETNRANLVKEAQGQAQLGINQQNADANTARATAYVEGKNNAKNKGFFFPTLGGVTYKADKATAGKFASLMKRISKKHDIDINSSNEVLFNKVASDFLSQYGDNQEVKDFITKLQKNEDDLAK